MNDAWRQTLTDTIKRNLNDMLDAGFLSQSRYDAAVALLEPEAPDWYEHPRAWREADNQRKGNER